MKLILITGHCREGKSYLTTKLHELTHIPHFALADELKLMTNELFAIFGTTPFEEKESMRPFYQIIGTEICRKHFGDDIWCEVLERKINALSTNFAIITDIRYINEYAYFKRRYECFTIRCHKKEIDNEPILAHSSEQQIASIPVDYTFENADNEVEFEYNISLLLVAILNHFAA